MKKLYFISIFAIFIGLVLTHQILGLTIGQIQTYNGTITSINYSEKSFILSSQISAVSKFIAAIWPWSKSNNQAIKVLATDDTKIQIKGTKGYINTNFSALKNNDRATVKGKITDISLSTYPATIVTASEIKVTYRPIIVVKKQSLNQSLQNLLNQHLNLQQPNLRHLNLRHLNLQLLLCLCQLVL